MDLPAADDESPVKKIRNAVKGRENQLFPETPAGFALTYAGVMTLSGRYAEALAELGLKPGDRVAAQPRRLWRCRGAQKIAPGADRAEIKHERLDRFFHLLWLVVVQWPLVSEVFWPDGFGQSGCMFTLMRCFFGIQLTDSWHGRSRPWREL
jgi:hypothetical protein